MNDHCVEGPHQGKGRLTNTDRKALMEAIPRPKNPESVGAGAIAATLAETWGKGQEEVEGMSFSLPGLRRAVQFYMSEINDKYLPDIPTFDEKSQTTFL